MGFPILGIVGMMSVSGVYCNPRVLFSKVEKFVPPKFANFVHSGLQQKGSFGDNSFH